MNLPKTLDALVELKAEIAALEQKKKRLEEEVLADLERRGLTSFEWGEGDKSGKPNRVTAVYSTTVKMDAAALEAELTPRQWNSITARVIDNSALEDQVARGKIDIAVVAKCSTEVPRNPYLKITPAH